MKKDLIKKGCQHLEHLYNDILSQANSELCSKSIIFYFTIMGDLKILVLASLSIKVEKQQIYNELFCIQDLPAENKTWICLPLLLWTILKFLEKPYS